MKLLVISNFGDSRLGVISEFISYYGFDLLRGYREYPSMWPNIEDVDLIILLGSNWSVYWSDVRSVVNAELALIFAARDRGVPVFGVCFGAQLLALSLGAKVAKSQNAEIGWYWVKSVSLPSIVGGRWMQWHYDSFSLPPQSDVVAFNDNGLQAFRHGRCFGTQFHPEIDSSVLFKWISDGGLAELQSAGIDPEQLVIESERNFESSRHRFGELLRWFLEDVAQRGAGGSEGTNAQD